MSNGIVSSITRGGQYEPFELQVARGQVFGHSVVNIYGFQGSVTTAYVPIWENASAYTYPVSATQMHLTSSVNTGADLTATILISGLDSGYNMISETLTLNGTTVVTTTNSYLRINSMVVTSGNPTGIIYLKDTSNTTTYAQINATVGRTQMAIYTVPAGYSFFLTRVGAFTAVDGNSTDYAQYRSWSTSSAGVISLTQQAPFVNSYEVTRVVPRLYTEKTDLQYQAKTSANTYAVSVGVEGYLIQNTVLTTQPGN
jgi:hypothetical protein